MPAASPGAVPCAGGGRLHARHRRVLRGYQGEPEGDAGHGQLGAGPGSPAHEGRRGRPCLSCSPPCLPTGTPASLTSQGQWAGRNLQPDLLIALPFARILFILLNRLPLFLLLLSWCIFFCLLLLFFLQAIFVLTIDNWCSTFPTTFKGPLCYQQMCVCV